MLIQRNKRVDEDAEFKAFSGIFNYTKNSRFFPTTEFFFQIPGIPTFPSFPGWLGTLFKGLNLNQLSCLKAGVTYTASLSEIGALFQRNGRSPPPTNLTTFQISHVVEVF